MPNTYTQIHIQAVFAVQFRKSLILSSWKDELHKYITGIIQNHSHKVLAINGMPDHIHILFGMRPTQSLSELMQDIKGDSSGWINRMKFTSSKFSWQGGYGAFSYNKSTIPTVIEYIKNQEEHHRKKDFLSEYKAMLLEFEVDYKEQYLFKSLE
ncbi:MAG: IS200/IS605 family transposase [Saprospiraceae bacterium]|jgi:putative transposase|nr:IS200/IS605 family transposase [Saprospiraceae bacterium]MBK7796539.1 IS200/IS605 family transposase [Saprospiraceae bacterium]MBK8152747.1 IS200/IS605 family transposase [Saprospiraceae bacterium]MBL0262208.1 IS200/IS605 family transposase [Saprospiraceae bacterium]